MYDFLILFHFMPLLSVGERWLRKTPYRPDFLCNHHMAATDLMTNPFHRGISKFFISLLTGKSNWLYSHCFLGKRICRPRKGATRPTTVQLIETTDNAAQCCQMALNLLAFSSPQLLRHVPIVWTSVKFLCISSFRDWRIHGWKTITRIINTCQKLFSFIKCDHLH